MVGRFQWIFQGALIIMMTVFGGSVAQADPTEEEFRSSFLVNFASYTRWPAENFASDDAPLQICMVGQEASAVYSVLNSHLAAMRASNQPVKSDNRPIEVLQLATLPEMEKHLSDGKHCHLAYFGSDAGEWIPPIKLQLDRDNAMLIGDALDFLEAGGQIAIVKRVGKLRPFANKEALASLKIKIDSRLLGILKEP